MLLGPLIDWSPLSPHPPSVDRSKLIAPISILPGSFLLAIPAAGNLHPSTRGCHIFRSCPRRPSTYLRTTRNPPPSVRVSVLQLLLHDGALSPSPSLCVCLCLREKAQLGLEGSCCSSSWFQGFSQAEKKPSARPSHKTSGGGSSLQHLCLIDHRCPTPTSCTSASPKSFLGATHGGAAAHRVSFLLLTSASVSLAILPIMAFVAYIRLWYYGRDVS